MFHHRLSHRVDLTVGFAAGSGCRAYEAAGPLSFYTQALVNNIDAHGHTKDVVELLVGVRADVAAASTAHVTQAPCAYNAKGRRVLLVSLVGTVPLSVGVVGTVDDAVRPLLRTLQSQVRSSVVPPLHRALPCLSCFITHPAFA
jgi:hypothetical protein